MQEVMHLSKNGNYWGMENMCIFNVIRECKITFQSGRTIYHPQNNMWKYQFSFLACTIDKNFIDLKLDDRKNITVVLMYNPCYQGCWKSSHMCGCCLGFSFCELPVHDFIEGYLYIYLYIFISLLYIL